MPDLQETQDKVETATKMDGQEVNGDMKGSSKKGRKRKLSEPDDLSSEESMEFNGFDTQGDNEMEPGSHVLKKLIAEAEVAEAQLAKRFRYSIRKNFDFKKEDEDSDDNRMHSYDTEHILDLDKIKKEKESDKSETDSVGIPNSMESELEVQKTGEISIKSTNSSSASSPATSLKSKGTRITRGVSPGSVGKPKMAVDMSCPAFKEPFKYGWKRELVFRASSDSSLKRMADIYYYTPKGKKVRSFREVAEFLNTKELTIDNFTFFKEPIGIDDPEKEIIRDAKRIRGPGIATTPLRRGVGYKKGTPGRRAIEEPVSLPTKAAAKSPKAASTGFKVKVPAKKTPQIKIKSPPQESEMLPPQRTTSTRRSQLPVEKPLPPKPKRQLTPKVQEPCSIRCSTSMGLIPSLQCRVCLCLYHPECVDGMEFAGSDDYVCKNCQQDTNESHQSQTNPSLTPPPLIPISMLGAQSAKSKHQVNLNPPKLQRIPKSDNTDLQSQNTTKVSKTSSATSHSPLNSDKKDSSWFAQTENEFLQSHDGVLPKPAQNIALMGGKRYIVVPKNNAMAVQPAITVKSVKIGDKAPILQNNSLTDTSNTVENSISIKSRTPLTTKFLGKDALDKLTDKDMSRDVSQTECTPCAVMEETEETCNSSDKTNKLQNDLFNTRDLAVETKKSVSYMSPERKTIINNSNTTSTNNDLLKVDTQQFVTSSLGTVQISSKRKQNQQETEQQQHFMDSVCAGYHALLRIFQYLKVQELLRAARVCKMWRDLAAHPSLWKTVRMKNSQVTDWDGLADTLQRRGTQHLDLRKMLVAGESDSIWKKFLLVIPRVISLVKLELCKCPVMVVEEVIKSCPQLEVLSAMSIKCDSLNLESVGNLKRCQELRLKAISGMSLQEDLTPLQELTQLTQLSLTSVKELGKKRIDIIQALVNLEALELGECSDFPDKFGTTVLIKLQKLERLRLEKGQGLCCTFDILDGVSKLQNLSQMELVNFDVKNGFDKCLANCKNIKRLLIIPTYISQSATSNNMVLGGVTELSNNLTHFVWGVTLELLRVTELFVDQCNLMRKQVTGDSIPVLKPVPCLKLIEDVEDENDNQKGDDKQPNLTNPQVDILPLPQLQKLLLTALPKTRVKILKIPFHATWRQSISDTATQ
ncbi:F-box/LRR-repeat protein 7 [Habropoda laboriosa]|uniref:F-box/LRR-repeat protein 7 n=1 Tax=Habropoda laboriosa TaxID=597456 RepID=A0A0L7QNZ7_9HYME|nr:F-box/LRR-repeat protein 7 [Habropoda laboriosa]